MITREEELKPIEGLTEDMIAKLGSEHWITTFGALADVIQLNPEGVQTLLGIQQDAISKMRKFFEDQDLFVPPVENEHGMGALIAKK